MTLTTLLSRAGITRWDRHFWFAEARLVGRELRLPDATVATVVRNCWLPALQAQIPGLQVVVAVREPDPVGFEKVIKKSMRKTWNQQHQPPTQARLLK